MSDVSLFHRRAHLERDALLPCAGFKKADLRATRSSARTSVPQKTCAAANALENRPVRVRVCASTSGIRRPFSSRDNGIARDRATAAATAGSGGPFGAAEIAVQRGRDLRSRDVGAPRPWPVACHPREPSPRDACQAPRAAHTCVTVALPRPLGQHNLE